MPVLAASDSVALALVELGAILLGLAILARISDRIGVSPIPAYLLAGLLFGEGGLAAPSLSADFLELAAEVGVVLLLLTLGLEYSADELADGIRRGWRAGHRRSRAQRDARCPRGIRIGLERRGRGAARGSDLHLVVRGGREGAVGSRASREPGDTRGAHGARHRGSGDGGLSARRRRHARRAVSVRGTVRGRRCARGRGHRARRRPALRSPLHARAARRARTKPCSSGCSA